MVTVFRSQWQTWRPPPPRPCRQLMLVRNLPRSRRQKRGQKSLMSNRTRKASPRPNKSTPPLKNGWYASSHWDGLRRPVGVGTIHVRSYPCADTDTFLLYRLPLNPKSTRRHLKTAIPLLPNASKSSVPRSHQSDNSNRASNPQEALSKTRLAL